MQRKSKTIITIGLIAIIIASIMILNAPLKKQIIPAKFKLGDKPGFDLTPEQLTFGQITNQSGASRGITIENNFDQKVKITIKAKGEIKNNIAISENNFLLNPDEIENVSFSVYANGLTEFKDYVGKIIIITKKA